MEIFLISLLIIILAGALLWQTLRAEHYRQLSTVDELTGVPNFRGLKQRLGEEVALTERYGKAISVIFLDIDLFRDYNKRYGHPKANVILQRVAASLKRHLRQTDIVGRYGGEEFVVVLPETGENNAVYVANLICQKIAAESGDTSRNIEPVTITGGVATSVANCKELNAEELLQRANAAMLKAKEAGRNRVEVG